MAFRSFKILVPVPDSQTSIFLGFVLIFLSVQKGHHLNEKNRKTQVFLNKKVKNAISAWSVDESKYVSPLCHCPGLVTDRRWTLYKSIPRCTN